MNTNNQQIALDWWDSLPENDRAILKDVHSIDCSWATDQEILSIWEKENPQPVSSSSVLDGWYEKGQEIASENDPKGRTIAYVYRAAFTPEEANIICQLIVSAPRLKQENERLKSLNTIIDKELKYYIKKNEELQGRLIDIESNTK